MAGLYGYKPSTNIRLALTRVPEVRRQTRRAAAAVRNLARPNVLRDTGAGARSIKVVPRSVGGANEFHVSWDKDHFYMGFHPKNLEVLRAAAQAVQRGSSSASADLGE